MKVLLLISDSGKGNNFLAQTISKIKDVKLQVITIKKYKGIFAKIKKIIINFVIFFYSPSFKLKYLILNLLKSKSDFINDANSLYVVEKIDKFKPDLLVISGTKKINQNILKKIKFKINLHNGIVPEYRGVSSVEWVSYEHDFGNFGVTVHEATDSLDEGPLLACKRILPFKGEPLFLFKHRIFWEGYFILINCIKQIVKKKSLWIVQDNINSRNLKKVDKPIDFYKYDKKKLNNNFYKFSLLNGSGNMFFIINRQLNKLKIRKGISPGWYVFSYHDICSEKQALQYKKLKYPNIYTTLNNFKSHIKYMRSRGEIISVKDGLKNFINNNIKNEVFFSITFDDGLYSSTIALEYLKYLKIIPTLFLNGKTLLDRKTILNNHPHLKTNQESIKKKYISLDDIINQFSKKNFSFEIGSHTNSHHDLSKLNVHEIQYEIIDFHNRLQKLLGNKIPYFAYPFGKLDARNYHADKAARSLNVKIFECYGGINKSYLNHFNILRIGVHNESETSFHKLLSSQWIR